MQLVWVRSPNATLSTILAIKIEDEFKKIEFPITGFRRAMPRGAWSHGSHARVLAAMAPDALRKKPPPPSRRLSESPLRIRGVLGRARAAALAPAQGTVGRPRATRRTALARTNARLRMASGESTNPNPNPNQPSDGAEW